MARPPVNGAAGARTGRNDAKPHYKTALAHVDCGVSCLPLRSTGLFWPPDLHALSARWWSNFSILAAPDA
jgi:hypothetical protein